MKKLLNACMSLMVVLLGLQGCASKELQTQRYFDALTKDEVLQAGREVLINKGDFIIDSYRDRLEATKIDVVFNILQHEDRVLSTVENECGTNATLTIVSNYSVDKALSHDAFFLKQTLFWNQVESVLEEKEAQYIETLSNQENNSTEHNQSESNTSKITISPIKIIRKEMSKCVNKSEFENGVIKIETSNLGDIYYEDL